MSQQINGSNFRQRGSALIVTIMMMMTLGLLGLNTVNQHLNAALALTRSEKTYFQSWELAVSSLNWGLAQSGSYQHAEQWQCVESSQLKQPSRAGTQASSTLVSGTTLRSCVRPSATEGQYVLRGEGRYLAGFLPVYLYQLATLKTAEAGASRFESIQNGWLDFCPFKDETQCYE